MNYNNIISPVNKQNYNTIISPVNKQNYNTIISPVNQLNFNSVGLLASRIVCYIYTKREFPDLPRGVCHQ